MLRHRAPGPPWTVAYLLVVVTVCVGAASAEVRPRVTDPRPGAVCPARDSCFAGRPLLARTDLWYGLGAVACVAVTVPQDRWLTEEVTESSSAGARRLSRLAQPLGNAIIVLPATAIVYGIARWSGHTALAGSAERSAVSILATGAATLVLKEAFGRLRPHDSQDDAAVFRPFSGHSSFPSGHASVAFAVATTLAEEHPSWGPRCLAYSAASLVAWSRVRDREHWTSDVVGGAALGICAAREVERRMRSDSGATRRLSRLTTCLGPSGVALAWRF